MRLRSALATLAALFVAGCATSDTPITPSSSVLARDQAQLTQDNKFIVVYKNTVTNTRAEISQHVNAQSVRVERVFDHALHGWSGQLTPAEVQRLRSDPHVAFIEADAVVSIQTSQSPVPSWGLDRIDQRNLPLDNSYTYGNNGAGVHFYGIDTGILYSNVDFGGRASFGFDAIDSINGNGVDCAGHGTHTASTAAGTTYGVAKGMTIIGVRVLDCTGTGSIGSVIAGVDWVTQHAIKPAVANMSLGGSASAALDLAVANSIASGVVYAIASGNSTDDACNYSPARVSTAITVNATDINDSRASFSNFGTCTDIFAPGVNITAAWIGANNATNTISGTSMATPHVAGVIGLYLQQNPAATPAQVATALTTNATSGAVPSPGVGSPNKLLYMGFIAGNQPPTASITVPTNNASFNQGSSVTFTGSGSDPEDGALTGASLVWTSSINGQIGTGASFSTSSLSVGTHTITLTAKDSKGATGTATRSITIAPPGNQPPVAQFTYSCVGFRTNQCQADASPSTDDVGVVQYAWNWGDGKSEVQTVPVTRHTWATPGTYTVTLTVSDGGGLTGSIVKSIAVSTVPVNQPPTASITAPTNNSSVVQGTSVTFTGGGSDPEDGALSGASLVWSSSINGQIGTGTSFSTTSLSVGTHTITLTATDSKSATGTATRTLTITAPNQPPTASITAPTNNSSVVQGTSVTFTGSGTDPEDGALSGASLVWSSSINGQIGTGTSFSTTSLSVGTHTITLTATDSKSATGTATRTITITAPNQPPTASITAPTNNTSVVQGTSVTFTGSGTDPEDGALSGASLVWSSSINGQIGTGTSFSTTSLSVGTHTITLTATDSKSATGTATRTITITAPNQPPTASITAPTNNSSVVQGTSVTFTGSGSDPEDGTLSGASLVWTSSINGQIGTGTSFSITSLSVGTHTITLTATDSKSATGTATRTVTITAPNQPPTASITAPTNNSSVVQGTSVTFTGSGSDPEDGALSGASLVWSSSINGQIGTGTSFSTTALSVGTHTITLTATDSKGATGTATRTITITAPGNQPPVAKFTYSCVGFRAHQCQTDGTTSTDDVGVVQWSWTWGDGKVDTQNVAVIRHTYTAAGSYTVTLTVTDGGGLTSSTTTTIVVP